MQDERGHTGSCLFIDLGQVLALGTCNPPSFIGVLIFTMLHCLIGAVSLRLIFFKQKWWVRALGRKCSSSGCFRQVKRASR